MTGQPNNQRGFTLLESVIAAVLVMVLAYLVMTLSKSGVDAQSYAQRMARVTEITQELVEELRADAQSSIHLFANDANGNAYRSAFDLTGLPAAIDTARLPEIVEDGVFEVETALGTRTGNSLALARHAWSDEFRCTSGETYRIDIYRIVYYYPTAVDAGPQTGSPWGLNIVQWVSEPIADGGQIDKIDDATDQREVLDHLLSSSPDTSGNTHASVELVWVVGEDPTAAGTFRQITSLATLVTSPESPRDSGAWRVYSDPSRSRVGMLHYRWHSLATNFAPPICGVAKYTEVSATGDGFPHGFETQIIGPSAARQILLHLSVVSTRTGRLAWHDAQVVTDARDL